MQVVEQGASKHGRITFTACIQVTQICVILSVAVNQYRCSGHGLPGRSHFIIASLLSVPCAEILRCANDADTGYKAW